MNSYLIILLVSLFSLSVVAQEKLPDPLSLQQALSFAENNYPKTFRAELNVSQATIETELSKTAMGLDLRAKAVARWVEPQDVSVQYGRQDHQAKLLLKKPIYDFGRTKNAENASLANEKVSELQLEKIRAMHKLDIMRAFFNVLLADLNYSVENEAMAIAFIDFDRKQDRRSLNQMSDIDVLEAESDYLKVRKLRYQSETEQRSSRAALSILLNTPGDLPSKLRMPDLDYANIKKPILEDLYARAEEQNLDLLIIREKIKDLRFQMRAIRADRRPVLSVEAEAGVYEREFGSNDQWRAGLLLDIPLYQAGSVSQKTASRRIDIQKLENQLYEKTLAIKQEILEHWLALDYLIAEKQAADKNYEYRELYLDRARANYELEFQSDLGDAMVKLTEAALYSAQTNFEIAMRWEQLSYLTQTNFREVQ